MPFDGVPIPSLTEKALDAWRRLFGEHGLSPANSGERRRLQPILRILYGRDWLKRSHRLLATTERTLFRYAYGQDSISRRKLYHAEHALRERINTRRKELRALRIAVDEAFAAEEKLLLLAPAMLAELIKDCEERDCVRARKPRTPGQIASVEAMSTRRGDQHWKRRKRDAEMTNLLKE